MINRENWKQVKKYLAYRSEVDQLSPGSVELEKDLLRHCLEWAGEVSFVKAPSLRPTLPEYLLSARLDGGEGQLSRGYVAKVMATGRRFFHWLRDHQSGYKTLSAAWLDTLKPPRMTVKPREHEFVTLEEIRAIASAPVANLAEKRIRAAAVFWFLSGIRIGAFLSLPLAAVDVNGRTVKQWPSLGVHTKFQKQATTHLLNIPDLLAVVADWDREVRAVLPENGLWFAPLLPGSGEVDAVSRPVSNGRSAGACKDLRDWLARVGLPYHSPHKFRHGFAVFSLKQAKDIADFKAISQNLMHSSLSITDGVYGMFSDQDVGARIGALGKNGASSENILAQIARLLEEHQTKNQPA